MTKVLVDGRLLEGGASGVRDVATGVIRGLREMSTHSEDEVVVAGTGPTSDLRLSVSGFMEIGLPLAAARGRFDAILIPRARLDRRFPLSEPCL